MDSRQGTRRAGADTGPGYAVRPEASEGEAVHQVDEADYRVEAARAEKEKQK